MSQSPWKEGDIGTLPLSIDILGFKYKVSHMKKSMYRGSGAIGVCDAMYNHIYIYTRDMQESVIAETLLHEVLHALYYEMGVEQGAGEEHIVRNLSRGMYAVLQANPEFAGMLANSGREVTDA